MDAICVCRHCSWGQDRGELSDVLEMAQKHSKTGHDVDLRLYNPDVETAAQPGIDESWLTVLEETGELKKYEALQQLRG
jgi:hypothetical protein